MQFHMNQNKDLLQKKILMLKSQLIAVNKIKELKIQNARTDFKSFIELMFGETTATCNFQKSFHTDVLIAICQLKADRKLLYKNVIITIPPGHTKTLICNVLYTAWVFGRFPQTRFICGGNNQDEVNKRNMEIRELMQTDIYKKIFPNVKLINEEKTWLTTNFKGGRRAVTTNIAMRFTGGDADELIIDDPNDTTTSQHELEKTNDWFQKKAIRRLRVGKRNNGFLLIQQRVAQDDLTGFILRSSRKDYFHLTLKAEDKDGFNIEIPLIDGNKVVLQKEAGYLWDMFAKSGDYDTIKNNDEENLVWQIQYLGNVDCIVGNQFKREWLQEVDNDKIQSVLTRPNILTIMSIDAAISEQTTADYTAILFFAYDIADGTLFLIDVCRKKIAYTELEKLTADLCVKWNPRLVLVENKANGSPLLDRINRGQLINNNTGEPLRLVAKGITPIKSKIERAHNSGVLLDAKRFFLPKSAPWRVDFDSELLQFPNGKNDDQVDSFTQCIRYIESLRMSNARVSIV